MNDWISGSRVGRRDELGLDLGVDAVEARVVDRRRADPDVDFGRAGLAQELDDALRGRAADDRVVDHDQPLAVDDLAQRIELDRHAPVAQPGRRLDERAPGVPVAVHPLAVRQAGLLGEPGRRGRPGIRDGHHEVGVDRVLEGQLHAHLATGLVQVATLHVRIGPGEVDQLEDAQRGRRVGEPDRARRLARLEDHHLARLDVAHVLRADDVEGRRLGRQAPARGGVVVAPQAVTAVARIDRGQAPQHEWPEAERIAHADDAALVEDDQAVRAAHPRQHLAQGLDRVRRRLVRKERGQQLRVRRGRQARPAALEQLEQVARVDQIAVVADRERPARSQPVGRLGVLPDRRPGRRVAAMGDGQLAAQARQPALVEDRADHPEVLVEHQLLAVADRQPGRFLAAVLQGEQAERGDRRGIGRLGTRQHDPEHATHQEGVSQPRARASPWSHACRRSRTGTSRRSATPPPRSSTAPPIPAALSSIRRRSPPTEPIVSTGSPCWRASSVNAAP